ncbi:MAG TPA: hypothetical protein VIW45_05210 [Vicinamibacterales bacterium]|jgi:hypothetical protein
MLPRRAVVIGLMLSLLLVPALARAGQQLDFGARPTAASSFSRSVDVPRDLVVIVPDRSSTHLDVETLRHPAAADVAVHPETLPDDPDRVDADTLRGPPSVV